MPATSEAMASDARYCSGLRSGRGLTGADRSELIAGLGSRPTGGVAKSRVGPGGVARRGRDPGTAGGGTGSGSPVSWNAASLIPRSRRAARARGGVISGRVGRGAGGLGTRSGVVRFGLGSKFDRGGVSSGLGPEFGADDGAPGFGSGAKGEGLPGGGAGGAGASGFVKIDGGFGAPGDGSRSGRCRCQASSMSR